MCPRYRGEPAEGTEVTIVSLGDPELGVVVEVSDGRTRLEVATESGERAIFRLRPATGRFESTTAAGSASAAEAGSARFTAKRGADYRRAAIDRAPRRA